jgi:hypothetical protein
MHESSPPESVKLLVHTMLVERYKTDILSVADVDLTRFNDLSHQSQITNGTQRERRGTGQQQTREGIVLNLLDIQGTIVL